MITGTPRNTKATLAIWFYDWPQELWKCAVVGGVLVKSITRYILLKKIFNCVDQDIRYLSCVYHLLYIHYEKTPTWICNATAVKCSINGTQFLLK